MQAYKRKTLSGKEVNYVGRHYRTTYNKIQKNAFVKKWNCHIHLEVYFSRYYLLIRKSVSKHAYLSFAGKLGIRDCFFSGRHNADPG